MNRKTILGVALIIITFWSYTQILFQVKATPTYYGSSLHSTLIASNGTLYKWLVWNYTSTDNLILYYNMDSIVGGKVLDISGNGYDGTLSGDIKPILVTGKYSNGLFFNVTTTSYTTTANPFSKIYGTLICWYKPNGYQLTNYRILTDSGGYCVIKFSSATSIHFLFSDTGSKYTTTKAVSDNVFHFIAATWDSIKIREYVDGAYTDLSGTPALSMGSNSGTFMVGSNTYITSGVVDEVKYYNRVLSSTELNWIYTNSAWNTYEVFDSSELLYHGITEPTLTDFNANEPTFTATNTIQLNTVYIGMGIGILGAIVSLGLWWIGILIIGFNLTVLYQFLFDAKVITGYTIASNNQVISLVETYTDLRIFCLIIFIAGCVCVIIGALNKLMND
jgi:hypothetical protein